MTKKQKIRLLTRWTLGKVDPEAAYAELERMRKQGGLTTERLLAAAEAEDHALHAVFEWDDAIAATEYRKVQARALIRSVAVVVGDEPARRVYVHVPALRGDGIYERAEIVAENIDMFALALQEALGDLGAAQERVADLRRYSEGRADRVAVIAIVAQALSTAREAIQQLH